jgi:hypothetical protein
MQNEKKQMKCIGQFTMQHHIITRDLLQPGSLMRAILTLFNAFATPAEVNDCLRAEVEKIEQDQEEVRSKEDEEIVVHVLDEKDNDTPLDDEINQCTQNWPDWHDMSMSFE